MKATDLTARITEHIQRLAEATDHAAVSGAMRDYLTACSRFYHYSPFNQLLIQITNPIATHVAGYTTWQKLNRFVRRGEHGIPILAPCIYKADPDKDDSPKKLQGFRVVYVFDVAQTDGEPLPPPPYWKSPARRL